MPVGVMMSCAALMCLVLSSSPGLWVAIAALALMALFQDLAIPSVWAYAQDVGGKNVGAALGWGNMWGNLGAAVSPPLLNKVVGEEQWDRAFLLCAAAFLVSGLCALGIDASKPITPPPFSCSPIRAFLTCRGPASPRNWVTSS